MSQGFNEINFKASGFIYQWKTHDKIMFKRVGGKERPVSQESTDDSLNVSLPDALARFSPKNIYNTDETGLLYKLKPDKTLEFKGKKFSAGKKSKERRDVLVGASITGQNLTFLITGTSTCLHCFKIEHHAPPEYNANSKASSTAFSSPDFVTFLSAVARKGLRFWRYRHWMS